MGHHQDDLLLGGGSGIHDARHTAAAEHQYPVGQLQQNVQILAHIQHGDTLFLLLIDKIIDGIFKGVLDGLSTGKYMLKAHLELNNFSPSIFKFRINNNISDHTYNLNGDLIEY